MKWLSVIHHYEPMKSLDRTIFNIEFILCQKWAKNLKLFTTNFMWYQYHSLDLVELLLSCVVVIVFPCYNMLLFVYQFFAKEEKESIKG
ncbi:rCG56955, partial [Rattus norvegicus]